VGFFDINFFPLLVHHGDFFAAIIQKYRNNGPRLLSGPSFPGPTGEFRTIDAIRGNCWRRHCRTPTHRPVIRSLAEGLLRGGYSFVLNALIKAANTANTDASKRNDRPVTARHERQRKR